MRPYIITHMMTSVDGRIDCPMVAQISGEEYYVALASLGTSSKISGRVTAALECSAVNAETAPVNGVPAGKESVYVGCTSEEYTIVVDTFGKLKWGAGEDNGHPLLCITSEEATQDYLDSMHNHDISWIATGKGKIDMARAMELLYKNFSVERVVVVGGGHICGGFLAAGLVDEVSEMIAPGIDGRKGRTAVFDGIVKQDGVPYKLSLKSVEQMENGVVWLRYKVVK